MAITALLMCSCIYEDLSDCPNFIQGIGKPVDVEFCVSCTDSIEPKYRQEKSFSTGTSREETIYMRHISDETRGDTPRGINGHR